MSGVDARVTVHEEVSGELMAAVAQMVQRAAAVADHPPLGDHQLAALKHRHADLVALTVLDGQELLGYGQLSPSGGTWEMALVVDPRAGDPRRLTRSLLHAGVAVVSARGGGHITYWTVRPSGDLDQIARDVGFSSERELFQLRVDLPLGAVADPARAQAAGLALRSFQPGVDEAEWVRVNNRAFAGHPEQGNWDVETLVHRESEPWFDPAGFVVLEEDGHLVGSCWTKVHGGRHPPLGEIYVISIDPDLQGRGLGRVLTVAGLDRLSEAGLRHGMLYVDRANGAAVALYHSLGFVVDHLDRAYGRQVARSGE